jgi:hypothetical protein
MTTTGQERIGRFNGEFVLASWDILELFQTPGTGKASGLDRRYSTVDNKYLPRDE